MTDQTREVPSEATDILFSSKIQDNLSLKAEPNLQIKSPA
jgi:hypothetical protein